MHSFRSLRILKGACSLALLLAPIAVMAQTSNLSVSASVADSCTIVTTGLDFGSLSSSSATNEATPGSVDITCTADKTAVTVSVDGGNNASSGQRRMDDGATAFVPYNVYSDSGRTTLISENGALYTGNLTANVTTQLPLYGQVPSGGYSAGSYGDTLVITLTF